MKRFHVHLNVDDLDRSIGFYSRLFAAEPARIESDYAKWMLEDPPVNFAISTRGGKPGIDEGTTTCCYARSEKHWVTDPQGVAWEHFHTLGDIPVFNETPQPALGAAAACCAPGDGSTAAKPASSCC